MLQGVDGWDLDLPTYLEANWITSTVAKTIWVAFYILVYGVRPVVIRPKPMGAPMLESLLNPRVSCSWPFLTAAGQLTSVLGNPYVACMAGVLYIWAQLVTACCFFVPAETQAASVIGRSLSLGVCSTNDDLYLWLCRCR